MTTQQTHAVGAHGPVDERALLVQLTAIQARRYARHPLFWIPLAVGAVTLAATLDDAPRSYYTLGDHVGAAFLIGVFGFLVAYRLTRTEDKAIDLLPSAPTEASTRTLALLGACLVPAAAGVVVLVLRIITWFIWPPGDDLVAAAGGWVGVIPMQVDGFVVASFGGPALGVAVGRWIRFPGAGVLAALVLTLVVTFMVGGALQIPGVGEHWYVRGLGNAMPWTDWMLVDESPGQAAVLKGMRPGSPWGHLVYAISLCGLACWAAVMKDAIGATRARWARLGWILGVVAVGSYIWTLAG